MKIPKGNGKPQLWMRREGDLRYGIRIIYPSGRVEYAITDSWKRGCTSMRSQAKARKECERWSRDACEGEPEFVCYL